MEKLYSIQEISEYLGIGMQTLNIWRSQKRNLDFVKVGHLIRYRESDVRLFLERQTVEVD